MVILLHIWVLSSCISHICHFAGLLLLCISVCKIHGWPWHSPFKIFFTFFVFVLISIANKMIRLVSVLRILLAVLYLCAYVVAGDAADQSSFLSVCLVRFNEDCWVGCNQTFLASLDCSLWMSVSYIKDLKITFLTHPLLPVLLFNSPGHQSNESLNEFKIFAVLTRIRMEAADDFPWKLWKKIGIEFFASCLPFLFFLALPTEKIK